MTNSDGRYDVRGLWIKSDVMEAKMREDICIYIYYIRWIVWRMEDREVKVAGRDRILCCMGVSVETGGRKRGKREERVLFCRFVMKYAIRKGLGYYGVGRNLQ